MDAVDPEDLCVVMLPASRRGPEERFIAAAGRRVSRRDRVSVEAHLCSAPKQRGPVAGARSEQLGRVGIDYWFVGADLASAEDADKVVRLVAEWGYRAQALDPRDWWVMYLPRSQVRSRLRVIRAALTSRRLTAGDRALARADRWALKAWLDRTRRRAAVDWLALKVELWFPELMESLERRDGVTGEPETDPPTFEYWASPSWVVEATDIPHNVLASLAGELDRWPSGRRPTVVDVRDRFVTCSSPARVASHLRIAHAGLPIRGVGRPFRFAMEDAMARASEWVERVADASGDDVVLLLGSRRRTLVGEWVITPEGSLDAEGAARLVDWLAHRGVTARALDPARWYSASEPADPVRAWKRVARAALRRGTLSRQDALVAREDIVIAVRWLRQRRWSSWKLRVGWKQCP